MKPDGTHTVAELAEIARTELQSWERIELARELADISELLKSCTITDINTYTPYWAYEEEQEGADEQEIIENALSTDLAQELIDRGDEDVVLDMMDEHNIIAYLKERI